MISIFDLLKFGRDFLFPKEPVSLYRYVEILIERVVPRKHNYKTFLEIGPGTDCIFKYLKPEDYETATIIDYSDEILEFNKKNLPVKNLECIKLNIEDPEQIKSLNRKWDYIVCNSLIEHLKDDVSFIENVRPLLNDGGIIVGSTVLHQALYCKWDIAVGHYRRYSPKGLYELFKNYSEVDVIQTSMIQELVRPFFFSRIEHLLGNTIEENNLLFGKGYLTWGKPPYAAIYPVLRFFMPVYLLIDWQLRHIFGGICIVVARK